MSWLPGPRALPWVGAWIALATLAVAWPALAPAVVAGALALAALAAVDVAALVRRAVPTIRRRLPERAHRGRPGTLAIELTAPAGGRFALLDELPRDLADEDPAFHDLRLRPGEVRRLDCVVRPSRRGKRPLGSVRVLETGPLGLAARRHRGGEGETLAVYPDTRRLLTRDALQVKQWLLQEGLRPTRRRGEGTEFETLRDYVPGDDPRRIDWSASARRPRPLVRTHRHERNHTLWIAVDSSRLMASRHATGTKLDSAVDAALALAHAGLAAGDHVGLVVFDREVRARLAPCSRPSDFSAFVERLGRVEPERTEASYGALLRELSRHARGRALVVLLTDFVEADPAVLHRPLLVLARRKRLLLVALRDPLLAEIDRDGAAGLHRRLVLEDLARDREVALEVLRRQGVATLDLPPESITAPVLGRYLELRERE